LLLLIAPGVTPVEQMYETHTYHYSGGALQEDPFRYRLLKPARVEAGRAYPLVVFLHGAGERGDDNVSQLKYLPTWMAEPERRDRFPCFLLAPQCRANDQWVRVPWGESQSRPLAREPSDAMKVVLGILDHVISTYPVDENRVYLTGLSMGGYGCWDLALRQPMRFAAVAPICGGGDESQAARLIAVPILAYHGDADQAVPVVRTRRMIEAIRQAGGQPLYRELPGVGHDSWTAAYTNADGVVPWMFQQLRKP